MEDLKEKVIKKRPLDDVCANIINEGWVSGYISKKRKLGKKERYLSALHIDFKKK